MVKAPILISVIIPVYNGERFIQKAIRSVLDQNCFQLQIIVVDDGSSDNTKNKVLAFDNKVTYIYQENQGPAAARNRGLQVARGRILGFLDADDTWTPRRLELLLRKFREDDSLDIVMGHVLVKPLSDSGTVPKNLLQPHSIPLFASGLFKRDVFEKVGPLDSSLRFSEDQDWFLRAKEKGVAMVIIKEVVLIRKAHANNVTKEAGWADVDIIKVLKKSLDRRRKKGKGKIKELPKLSDYSEKN